MDSVGMLAHLRDGERVNGKGTLTVGRWAHLKIGIMAVRKVSQMAEHWP